MVLVNTGNLVLRQAVFARKLGNCERQIGVLAFINKLPVVLSAQGTRQKKQYAGDMKA